MTTLSFDISVLELFWTLGRGFKDALKGQMDKTYFPVELGIQADADIVTGRGSGSTKECVPVRQ